MRNHLVCATTAISLLTGSAFAQSGASQTPATPPISQPSAAGASSPAALDAMNATKGITKAKSANFAVRFVSPKPAELMSSKLVGTAVYNNQNDKLGTIDDLVIDEGKTLSGVVVSVGGFLGIGESYVLIDPSTLVVDETNGTWKAYIDTSKDNLKSAPKSTYSRAKS